MAGESLHIKGDITASEDLRFEGRIEGTITAPGHVVTVGTHATIDARIEAKAIVVGGHLSGDAIAKERIELHETAEIEGTIETRTLVVKDGAIVRAMISMPDRKPARATAPAAEVLEAAVA